MLYWAVVFLVLTIVLGFVSFSGVIQGATDVTRTLFYAAFFAFVATLIIGFFSGRKAMK